MRREVDLLEEFRRDRQATGCSDAVQCIGWIHIVIKVVLLQKRQLLLVEEHRLHARLTIVTIAEVLLERIGASRVNPGGEVAVAVS